MPPKSSFRTGSAIPIWKDYEDLYSNQATRASFFVAHIKGPITEIQKWWDRNTYQFMSFPNQTNLLCLLGWIWRTNPRTVVSDGTWDETLTLGCLPSLWNPLDRDSCDSCVRRFIYDIQCFRDSKVRRKAVLKSLKFLFQTWLPRFRCISGISCSESMRIFRRNNTFSTG